jgi:nitronate monooxygenase
MNRTEPAAIEPRIATRLTRRFGIAHPVLNAPMALAAGGRLAGAISRAGGLGLIGGGDAGTFSGEPASEHEFALAEDAEIGSASSPGRWPRRRRC